MRNTIQDSVTESTHCFALSQVNRGFPSFGTGINYTFNWNIRAAGIDKRKLIIIVSKGAAELMKITQRK